MLKFAVVLSLFFFSASSTQAEKASLAENFKLFRTAQSAGRPICSDKL